MANRATVTVTVSNTVKGLGISGPLAAAFGADCVVRLQRRLDMAEIASGTVDMHGLALAILATGNYASSRKASDAANAAAGVTAVKAVKAVKPPADVKAALTALKAVKPATVKARKVRKPAVKVAPVVKAEPRKLPESCKPAAKEWPARAVCDAARKAAMAHYNMTTNPGWQVWLGFVPPADMPAAAQAYLDAQAI